MKLLTYHIENYGKLKNTDGAFGEGLTCFCENNGYGKSTLSSFLKAMFYGLPSYTVASKAFNDRQHFYPFDGGKLGGNVIFETGGKTYKIERFFDKKSGTGDELKIYCNGALCDEFGTEPGKALFGLDEEAFVKTVFITASEIEISSTQSINEKLNRTVEGIDDGDGVQSAVNALEKAQLRLKAKRGDGGLINQKKAEIKELEARAHNLREIGNGLGEAYCERESRAKEIAVLEQAEVAANENALLCQKWENYDHTAAQAQRKESALIALREKYPKGMPSAEERAALSAAIEEQRRMQGALSGGEFDEEKKRALLGYGDRFANGVPTEESLAKAQADIVRLEKAEDERNRLLSLQETDVEMRLKMKFAAGLPSEETLEEQRKLVEEYREKYNQATEISNTMMAATRENVYPQMTKKRIIPFVIAGVVFFIGGIIGMFHFLVGVIVTAVGFLGAGATLLTMMFTMRRKMGTNAPSRSMNITLLNLQGEIRTLEEKIRTFTVPYGYFSTMGAVYDFGVLEEDVYAYQKYLADKAQRAESINETEQECEKLRENVKSFLRLYQENGEDLQNGLIRLTAESHRYRVLLADEKAARGKEEQIRARLENVEKQISAIIEKYGFDKNVATMVGLKSLESDCDAAVATEKELQELKETLADYKEKNGLTERPQAENASLEGLHAQLRLLRAEQAACDKRIEEDERQVEKLSDVENDLALAREKLQAYENKYSLLGDTMYALKGAEQALKEKYVAPIKERFSHYAKMLEGVLNEKVSMDQNFRILFERGGENRSEKHFSAGERSLCALCLRLALIDNMYEEEQPFIIMDDPFVHLDEVHLERTASLMKTLAQEKQIIYFCCHESRKM